jgi:hypothetical protein
MKYGRFVALDANFSIVRQIQSDMIPFRDLRYYILKNEAEAIDEANNVFEQKGEDSLRILDYDLIGWALTASEKLASSTGGNKIRHSQAQALLWVPMARMGFGDTGRISRTFLELAMIVHSDQGIWTSRTRYTKSVRGVEPFSTREISENLQQIVIKDLKKETVVDFLVPAGLLKEIIGKAADAAEHLQKESLIQLQLLTEYGKPTNLARALVNAVERWWLTEILILYRGNLKYVASRIPLESLLYAVGESNQELSLQTLSNLLGLGKEILRDEIASRVIHLRDISIRLSDDEQEIVAIDTSAGLEWCNANTMVSRLASGPLWVWLVPVDPQRTIVQKEVTLLPLRYVLLEEFVSKIVSKEVQSLMILAPAGWGKTGVLLLIAQALEKKGLPIALYKGGSPRTQIPRGTIVFVDDVHTLNQNSLAHLARMQEEGIQIVMTLTHEFEFAFSEKMSKLKRHGINLVYEPSRLPPLSSEDAARLMKDNFPNLQPGDYERLMKKIALLNYSPEAIAFLSMQWEFIDRTQIAMLNPLVYSLFKTPPILFEVLQSTMNPYIEDTAEIAALLILNELGGEVLSYHESHIARLAREVARSKRLPRYYKSFIEPISQGTPPRVILTSGIRSFLSLAQNQDLSHRYAIDLYQNHRITKLELEWTTSVLDMIASLLLNFEAITDQFLDSVLSNETKKKQLELIPYIAHIGSNRLESKDLVEKYYGWLRNVNRDDFLELQISPLSLGRILNSLAILVDRPTFSDIDSVALPIFDMFRTLWKRRVVMPQDEFNASYLELLAAIARRKMLRGEFKRALELFEEGIDLAARVHHKVSHVRLLCDKIQILRILSPAFYALIKNTVSIALKEAKSIETLDTRPYEIIIRNQESMGLLWCGDVNAAEMAAKEAEGLVLDYEVDPPEFQDTTALELEKSRAWAFIERGLCEYEKENYGEARALFSIAKENLLETRHESEIVHILVYEPVVYLREGKIANADRLVASVNADQSTSLTWILSGSLVAYHYWLFENQGLERSEEFEELRKMSREFFPTEDMPEIMQWFDNLQRIIYHRKRREYGIAEELAFEFLNRLAKAEESSDFAFLDYLRTVLSFTLREIGICFIERGKYEDAAGFLTIAHIYWIPICGSQKRHSLDMLKECMKNTDVSNFEISGWQTRFEKQTDDLIIEMVDENRAISDYNSHFWVGVSDILEMECK